MKKRVKQLLHRAGLLSPAEKAYFDLRLARPHLIRRELELSLHGAPDGLPLPPRKLIFDVIASHWKAVYYDSGREIVDDLVGTLRTHGVNPQEFEAVLDFGCGSGILALAALKLGAAHATGIDNDPQALLATADNATRNGLGDRLAVHAPDEAPRGTWPVVVANILASALDALAATLAARTAPGGRIALSGILHGQQDALLERYGRWFERMAVTQEGDWVRIDGVRRRD